MADSDYKKGSLSLLDTVSMGTGVMIGAGIFALTGQIAEMAGAMYIYAFLAAAVVASVSSYAYRKAASAYPSAGGIAMILKKCYGKGVATGVFALFMALSMVINESLVARTFGTYVLQPFDVGDKGSWLIPALGVGLLVGAYLINLSGNNVIGKFSVLTAALKIGGVLLFAGAALVVAGNVFEPLAVSGPSETEAGWVGFLGATALGVLAYKGFTTITNSGGEIEEPKKNMGRAIWISLLTCTGVYFLVTLATGANLSVDEIVQARDYALAEAVRPNIGQWGVWFTVLIAVIATTAGVIASTFAVSRMTAMLTEMGLVPDVAKKMSGRTQVHTLTTIVALAIVLTILFDLSRIASLGIILYLLMDLAIQWGVLRHLKDDVEAKSWVLWLSMVLNTVVLVAFGWVKAQSDPMILWIALGLMLVVWGGEWWYLRGNSDSSSHEMAESA